MPLVKIRCFLSVCCFCLVMFLAFNNSDDTLFYQKMMFSFPEVSYHYVWPILVLIVEGICLSKGPTCMKVYLHKHNLLFIKETDTFGQIVV